MKRSTVWMTSLLWLVCGLALPACAQSDYYVRPGGAGKTGVTRADAFGDIEQARDAIRARSDGSITGDITVHLLPGTYFLERPLRFDARDSGRNGFTVRYQADSPKRLPVLSGGTPITGPWTPDKDLPGVYSAPANGTFRQLYVNEVPGIPARTPNTGWWQLLQWEDRFGSKSVRLKRGDILKKQWKRPEQIEFVTKFHWATARLHLGAWNTYDNQNVLFPPEQKIWTAIAPRENDQFYYLENALEFLDQPGEWYFDQTGRRVYYKPKSGEALSKARVVVPRLEHLILVQGERDRPVRNLIFDGLRFAHSQWLHTTAAEGYVGAQGHLRWDYWVAAPGAVELTHTRQVQIVNCRFENLGGVGLTLTRGTRQTRVEGNVFSRIGDTGVLVYTGEVNPDKGELREEDLCRGDVIRNNYVEKTGQETLQGPGIAVVTGRDIIVEHNEVAHTPYAGITFGYFTDPRTPSTGNKVQFNYVHHAMTELDDGAGIYIFHTKFDAPPNNSSLLVTRNFVHDVYRGRQSDRNPIAGIYLDEGTRGNILKENVVRNVGNWLHLNTGGGASRETLPERQQIVGNTDLHPAWEKAAGLEARFAFLRPRSAGKPAAAFPTPQLLLHLPLDRNTVASVHTQKTPSTDPSVRKAGAASLKFDGTAQYSIPPVNLGERFTISLWVRVAREASGDVTLFHSKDFGLWAHAPGGGKPVSVINSDISDARGREVKDVFADSSYPGAFPVGEWVHVALTVDRHHMQHRLWLNGRDVTRTDYFARDDFPVATPFVLGQSEGGARPFVGHMDDFRVYDNILRPSEIRSLAAGADRPR